MTNGVKTALITFLFVD